MVYRRPGVLALLVTALTVALALVAGCSNSGTATSRPEKPDLTVAVVPTTDSTGFYVALNDGFFAAQGLNVKYVPAASGERIINQQALGQVDISAGNYVSYIEAQENYNRGLRATNIPNPDSTQIAADMDIFNEASVMQPGFVGLFTRPGSPIKTAADLKGKTIGLNAPGNVAYVLLANYLESNGISPSDVQLKYVAFPLMTQALMSHQVDVAFLAEPFATLAETTVGAVPLTNMDLGASQAFPIEGYAVTKQWAQKYPKTLAAFQRALEQGQQIADTSRSEAERAMEAFAPTDGVDREVGALMTFEQYPLGAPDVVRVQRVADEMHQLGLNSSAFNVHEIIGVG
jgi:NitT/TauT family transport system substrate-binding protein